MFEDINESLKQNHVIMVSNIRLIIVGFYHLI